MCFDRDRLSNLFPKIGVDLRFSWFPLLATEGIVKLLTDGSNTP
jgi:hypothetical protein